MKLARPKVIFDATNPEHRKAYYSFIETNTWANSPFRFDIKYYGNTKGIMDRQLISYYLRNEFTNTDV
jgi:hypothetical protein